MKLLRFTAFALLVSIFLISNHSCKNPLDDLSNIHVGINGGFFANPTAILSFHYSDVDNSIPANIKINISGVGANRVFDGNGEKYFDVDKAGFCKLILSQAANPTNDNPVILNIKATADGCLPINTQLYLFSKTDVKNFTFTFIKYANAPANYKIQTYPANFYGKKALDTLVFNHTNNDGLSFTFKYPTAGVLFIHQNFQIVEDAPPTEVTVPAVVKVDSTLLSSTAIYNSTTHIDTVFKDSQAGYRTPVTQLFNGQPMDGNVFVGTGPIYHTITSIQTREQKIFIRYDKVYSPPHTDTIQKAYTYMQTHIHTEMLLPDTVALENVTATIISRGGNGTIDYAGFWDNGVYVDKPERFSGIVQIPEVFFKNSQGGYITPVYPRSFAGPVIEANFGGNYNMLFDGTAYDAFKGQYYAIRTILPAKSVNGKYTFTNDMFSTSNIYFFTNREIGCGYANINFNYAKSDTDLANLSQFYCYYKIEHLPTGVTDMSQGYKTVYYNNVNSKNIERLPAFNGDKVRVTLTTNHEYNICDGGNTPLLTQTQDVTLCDYVGSELKFSCNYNTVNYLKQFIISKLTVRSRLVCQTGSIVTMPNTQVFYTRGNCPLFNGTININGGVGNYTVKQGDTYKFYIISPYNQAKIFADDLPFNNNQGPIPIVGRYTNVAAGTTKIVYDGTLTFNPNDHSYSMDINIYNEVMQYNIPGCN
ncbi:MAG: hypothetical protein WCO54_07100 [Bacteroidota bacterium]